MPEEQRLGNICLVYYAQPCAPGFSGKENNPGVLLKELKTFTSKKLLAALAENIQESRKEWLLWMMERAGLKNSNVKNRQFWQQHNQPIELWSPAVIEQKINYIHNNPVEAGFVLEPAHWKYSSAIDYAGGKGVLEIDLIKMGMHELQARASGGFFPAGFIICGFNPLPATFLILNSGF